MLRAIHNNVVLQKKTLTASKGIYMPSADDDIYVILHIGEEVSTVKINQTVVLKELPKKISINLEEYYICSVDNIMAIVEEENE